MTNDSHVTRRRVLEATGGTAVVGLAGCTGTDTQTDDGEPDSESTETEPSDDESEMDHDETDDGDDGHDEEVGDPTDTATVTMSTTGDGNHFDPHVVRVTVGGTVTFTNESGTHSSTAYHPENDQPQLVPDGAAAWDSGLLSEDGATFEHTFDTEGVYHYHCNPHETTGMIGSIIVGEPDPHGQLALEEPPEDKSETVRAKISELNEMCNKALGHSH